MLCREYSDILISLGDKMGPMTFHLLWAVKANPIPRRTCWWKYSYVKNMNKILVQSGTAPLLDCVLVSFPFNLYDLGKNPFLFHFSYIAYAVINDQMRYDGIRSQAWFFSLALFLNRELKSMNCSLFFHLCWWQSVKDFTFLWCQ